MAREVTKERARRLCAAIAAMLVATLGIDVRAQVIDRILAVVDGAIVTLSDVAAADRFGLLPPSLPARDLASMLDRLVDRQLILAEVERYGAPQPDEIAVDARIGELRLGILDADQFARALAEVGLTADLLRGKIRESLRIESYVSQRFGSGVPATDDELVEYYRSHQAQFSRGGSLRPFGDVRTEVRAALGASRKAEQVRDWVEGLRRRANVNVRGANRLAGG